MSVEISAMMWRADLLAMDKIVLLRLADFANAEGGDVYPSVDRVAKDCGVSERHVQNVIKRQLTAGLLVMVRPGGGRNRPAEYRFDLDVMKRCMACGVSESETPHPTTQTPNPVRGFPDINPAPGSLNPAPGAPNPSVTVSNRQSTVNARDDAIAVRRSIWRLTGKTEDEIHDLEASGSDDGLAQLRAWLAKGLTASEIGDKAARAFDRSAAPIRKPWLYLQSVMMSDAEGVDMADCSAVIEQAAPVTPWAYRYAEWVRTGKVWMDAWGPRPGQAGCRVPDDVIPLAAAINAAKQKFLAGGKP